MVMAARVNPIMNSAMAGLGETAGTIQLQNQMPQTTTKQSQQIDDNQSMGSYSQSQFRPG